MSSRAAWKTKMGGASCLGPPIGRSGNGDSLPLVPAHRAGEDQLGRSHEGKCRSIGAAKQADRLALGAIEVEHLTWLQADADTERRVWCDILPSDGAHRASATLRLIKGEHALIAGGDDDRLMRTDRAEIVQRLLGTREVSSGGTDKGQGCSGG